MKVRPCVICTLTFAFFVVMVVAIVGFAQKKMPDTVQLKLDGAKMPPVQFSHLVHVQKQKIDCAVCHHKDKDPKQPQACTVCHKSNEVKDGAPLARDVFHKVCQTCHKENAAKGNKAPVQCTECHKK